MRTHPPCIYGYIYTYCDGKKVGIAGECDFIVLDFLLPLLLCAALFRCSFTCFRLFLASHSNIWIWATIARTDAAISSCLPSSNLCTIIWIVIKKFSHTNKHKPAYAISMQFTSSTFPSKRRKLKTHMEFFKLWNFCAYADWFVFVVAVKPCKPVNSSGR